MTKKDDTPPVLLIDDSADPGSPVKPGILYSSLTELRGFKITPSGTSLGIGGPVPEDAERESEHNVNE